MKRVTFVLVVLCAFLATGVGVSVASPEPPFETNGECLECHDVVLSGPAFSKVDFDVPAVDYARCNACHYQYHWNHYSGTCRSCHWDLPAVSALYPTPSFRSTVSGFFQSEGSLSTSAQELHSIHVNGSTWRNTVDAIDGTVCGKCHESAACSACHGPDIDIEHGAHTAGDPGYPPVTYRQGSGSTLRFATSTCVTPACHALASAGTPQFTPNCGSCHSVQIETHGYDTVDHVAADATLAGIMCSGCHDLDLATEHEKLTSSTANLGCAACHPAPRDTLGAWDQSCNTGGCHTPESSAPMHAGADSGHSVIASGEICLDCHGGSDLPQIHATAQNAELESSCFVCHGASGPPITNDCTVCHFTFEGHYDGIAHESSWNLANCGGSGCHTTRDLMGAHLEKNPAFDCAGCHASTDASVIAAIQNSETGCGSCHGGVSEISGHRAAHWANPLLEGPDGPNYSYYDGSMGVQPTGDCAGCHTSNLVDEHMGVLDPDTGYSIRKPRMSDGGQPLDCDSCHNSLDASVMAAITLGTTACDACHAVHGPIHRVHESAFQDAPPVDCAGCHSDNLVSIHNGTYTVVTPGGTSLTGCDVCHAYYEDPRGTIIQAAISITNDTRCTACHGAEHPDLNSHTATSTASVAGCGSCHGTGSESSVDVKVAHENAAVGGCAVCHSNPGRIPSITSETAECVSCHAAEGDDYHRALPAKHTFADMDPSCTSFGCHVSSALPETHEPYLAKYPEYDTTCALCHLNSDPGRVPSGATAACDSCHEVHGDLGAMHTAPGSEDCAECHGADVRDIHGGSAADSCVVCHNSTVDTSGTTACANCHDVFHSGLPAAHEATAPGSVNDCGRCHASTTTGSLNIAPIHENSPVGQCGVCHLNPDRVPDLTTRTAECISCHEIEGTEFHREMSGKHTFAGMDPSCVGAGCHASTMLPEAHEAYLARYPSYADTCELCHLNSDPLRIDWSIASADCSSCHEIHGDIDAIHVAPDSQECADCHSVTDVRAIHGDSPATSCAVCHNSTVDTSGTTACVNCHDYSPVETGHYAQAPHIAEETGGCSNCHFLELKPEHEKATSGPVDCVGCHSAPGFPQTWDKTCSSCHPTKHGQMQDKHRSQNASCGGSGCHNISDVADVHDALTGQGCFVCHARSDGGTATTDCASAGCHSGVGTDHHAIHDGRLMNPKGCEGCHFRYLDDEHAALGYTCATCHASADSVVIGAIRSGDRACLTCHPDSPHNKRQAYEFAPGNASMHRVRADLPGMRSSFAVNGSTYTMSLPSASTFLRSAYTYDTLVDCDSCHTYSGAVGPHGATMRVNIDPAYPNPYRVVTGSESYTAQLSANSPTGMSMSKNGSSTAKIICEKCHVLRSSSGSWSNVAHKEHDDRGRDGAFCNQCHVAVPHGWGRPRLLGYTTDPAPYRTWVGTSGSRDGGLQRISLKNYSPGNWQKSDCGAGCSSSRHPISGSSWPNTMGTGSAPVLGSVTGVVRDASTGAAIWGATVTLGTASTKSSGNGTYAITDLSPGTYTLSVTANGFESYSAAITVTAGVVTTADVALTSSSSAAGNNLASGKTFWATRYESSSYHPSKAGDDSLSTFWWSDNNGDDRDTERLTVDLGSRYRVKTVEIAWYGDYWAREYRVYTSTDNSSWSQVYSTSYASKGTNTITFSARDARYVRVECRRTGTGRNNGYGIAELRVFQ